MDECARGPACWARDSRCSAHQEHSRHEQVHGIEQTLRSSTAATAGRRSPAPPPAFVVATVDAPLPREAVARSRAPTGPRAQETAIGGRASERGQAGAAPRSCGRDNRRTFYKPRYFLLFNVILLIDHFVRLLTGPAVEQPGLLAPNGGLRCGFGERAEKQSSTFY